MRLSLKYSFGLTTHLTSPIHHLHLAISTPRPNRQKASPNFRLEKKMNRLPPELKLSLLHAAASENLASLLALSATSRALYDLYHGTGDSKGTIERSCLLHFAETFIPTEARVPCRILSSLPKENWLSLEPDLVVLSRAEDFLQRLEIEKWAGESTRNLENIPTIELKAMIKTHARIRFITAVYIGQISPIDPAPTTPNLYQQNPVSPFLLPDYTPMSPPPKCEEIRIEPQHALEGINKLKLPYAPITSLYSLLIMSHKYCLYPRADDPRSDLQFRSRFREVTIDPPWWKHGVQRKCTISLSKVLVGVLEEVPSLVSKGGLERMRDKCEVDLDLFGGSTWLEALVDRFMGTLDVGWLFEVLGCGWEERPDVILRIVREVAEIKFPDTIIRRR